MRREMKILCEEPVWLVIFPQEKEVKGPVKKETLLQWFPELEMLMKHFGDVLELKIQSKEGVIQIEKMI